jgi:hypothetical protein
MLEGSGDMYLCWWVPGICTYVGGSGDVVIKVGSGDMFLCWWVPGICSYVGSSVPDP